MMNCIEATRLLSEAQERKLALEDRISLKMHVMICSGCRNFGQQMDMLRQVSRAFAKGADEHTDKQDQAKDPDQ